MTARDRLLAMIPIEQREFYSRCIDRLMSNPNDPILTLFAALAEIISINSNNVSDKLASAEAREKRLTDLLRNSFKYAQEIDQQTLREIGALKPTAPWKRAVLGRTATWTTVSVINATLVVAGIQYLRDNDNATFKKHIENPDAWLSYAKNSRDAIDAANQQARAATAVATLFAAPSAKMEQTDGKISITFHESAITTKHENGAVTITLNDDTERMRAAFGPDFLKAARESRKTIEDDTK
jgi:hypothetical protein